MITGKLHGVDTILLIFPGFQWLTEQLVLSYAQHVEGVFSFTSYGIDVCLGREMLSWLRRSPSICVPKKLSLVVVEGKHTSRNEESHMRQAVRNYLTLHPSLAGFNIKEIV